MYGGLSRPTALDSDSPFAIANHALHDKSSPSIPTLKVPTRRAPPAAPAPYPVNQPPQQQQQPQQQGDWRNPQGQGGYPLREGARDAYMGAGAYNTGAGRYGPSPTPPPQQVHPQQQQGYYQQPAPAQGSRQPGGYPAGPYAQPPPNQGARHPQQPPLQPPQQATGPYPLTERPGSSRSPQPMMSPAGSYRQPVSPHPASSPYPNPPHPQQHQQQQPLHSPYPPHPQQLQQQAPPPTQQTIYPNQVSSPVYGVSPAQLNAPPGSYHHSVSPPPQGQGQAQGGKIDPRRSASRDSATGDELWQMFSSMDLRRTGQLGNKEVQELLSRDSRWKITPREDCVKMLMSIFDSDRSGFISFVEFEGLWAYIKDWHKIFLRFDRDNSGTIDRGELDQALQSFGYPLPRDLVRKLEKRFAPPKEGEGPAMKGITFDRFLMACVTVKHFTEAFRKRDVRNEGRLTIDYNTFMELVLDAPV